MFWVHFFFFFFLSIICFVYGIQFQTKNIKRYLSKYEWLETFVFLSFTLPSSSRAWRTHTRRKLGDSLDFECSLHRHNSNLQKVICRLERTMEKNSEDNRISILYNKSCLKQSLLNYIPSTFECCLFLFKKNLAASRLIEIISSHQMWLHVNGQTEFFVCLCVIFIIKYTSIYCPLWKKFCQNSY